MQLKPLPNISLVMGDKLPWTVYDGDGKVLAREGSSIDNMVLLQRILGRGHIADKKPRLQLPLLDVVDKGKPEGPRQQIAGAEGELALILRDLQQNSHPNVLQRIESLAEWLIDFYDADPDQCLGLMQLQALDHRLPKRLLQCAALALKLGRAMELSEAGQDSLVCAALTFDAALLPLNDTLGRQGAPLTEAQQANIRQHPKRSAEMLEAAGVTDQDWLLAVRHHHERHDGSGYPSGLQGEEVPLMARILAITDIYTAMIRPRGDRDAHPSRRVLRDLFLERGRLVDERLAAVFIRELGVHPPGTLWKLASGEVAVALRRSSDPAHPVVKCVVNRDGSPMAHPSLRDTRKESWVITESVSISQYRSALNSVDALWARVPMAAA